MVSYDLDDEELAWMETPANELWALDKLILARTLGYESGPTGLEVPRPGWYIVRPCVNLLGGGMGAQKLWLEDDTSKLPLGHFWCEFFEGNHYSVDYELGIPVLTVEGFKDDATMISWDKWVKIEKDIALPPELSILRNKQSLNVEYIGDKPIEIHYRNNPDFNYNNKEFLPVWEGQDTTPPTGYSYIEAKAFDEKDSLGRIGAFIK